jgi:hypothetical protein
VLLVVCYAPPAQVLLVMKRGIKKKRRWGCDGVGVCLYDDKGGRSADGNGKGKKPGAVRR